jgi:hypothetical protein
VFIAFFLLHCFIFRDVIAAIPSILSGDASIVREELVPFFDFGSQFWGETTSKLTSSEEVRTSYSFWTAWVRHQNILPFALIIMNAVSATILFYAFHTIGRFFYKRSLFGVASALLAALLIHTILLYAKVAHFYVLVIGFSMFALSLSLLCKQLFFRSRLEWRNITAVSLLTLLNPAIHYHVIFYVVAFLIVIIQLLFTFVMSKRVFWKYCKRNSAYFALIVLFSLVPYVLYVIATTSSSLSGVSTNIPVNYWMIYYASLSLPYIFSLDTAGHLDLIRHGNYLAPIPRFGSLIVPILIAGLFLLKKWTSLHVAQKLLVLTLFLVMLFAMWMTIGYSDNSPYSFHKVFGGLAVFIDDVGGQIGATIASGMGTFINILRFPHRFQFIYYYAVGVLLMLALVWLRDTLSQKLNVRIATGIVIVAALFPIIANNDYRAALTSGDLATFASPYRIPDDLKQIKQRLAAQPDRKLLVLPTLESGREITHDGKSYSFLDKYFIYYLNQPTFYYGVGADAENKIIAFLAYRALAYDEPWWQDIAANTIGATDILVPKNLTPRSKGVTYLEDIDTKIATHLPQSTHYQRTYDGPDFALYSLTQPQSNKQATLVDVEWKNLLRYLNNPTKKPSPIYFPIQIQKYLSSPGSKQLVTDSVERSFYDLYIGLHPQDPVTARPVALPFDPNYISSSNFTNNALSLSVLYAKDDEYNYLHENIPSLANLQRPSFVGLTKGTSTLDLSFTVPESGVYRLLLHGATKADDIQAKLGGQDVSFKKIADDRNTTGDYIDFSYFTSDVQLPKGSHVVTLSNTTDNALAVDSLTPVAAKNLPTESFAQGPISITPTDQPDVFNVTVEKYDE